MASGCGLPPHIYIYIATIYIWHQATIVATHHTALSNVGVTHLKTNVDAVASTNHDHLELENLATKVNVFLWS